MAFHVFLFRDWSLFHCKIHQQIHCSLKLKQMSQTHFLVQTFDGNAGEAVDDKKLKLTFKLFQKTFFCICLGLKSVMLIKTRSGQ